MIELFSFDENLFVRHFAFFPISKMAKKSIFASKKSLQVKKNAIFGLKLYTFFHISDNSADGGHERVSLQQQQPLQAQHVAQSGAATTCHMCSRRPTASFILLNCGHLPFCNQCSLFIIRENKNCPICNSSVEGFKKHH